jgi:hypothetical protein
MIEVAKGDGWSSILKAFEVVINLYRVGRPTRVTAVTRVERNFTPPSNS